MIGMTLATIIGWILCAMSAVLVYCSLSSNRHLTAQMEWHHTIPQIIALSPYFALATSIYACALLIAGMCIVPDQMRLLPFQFLSSLWFLALISIALAYRAWSVFRPSRRVQQTQSASDSTNRDNEQRSHDSTDQFTVFSLNCRYGRASAQNIIAAVEKHHVDALCLVEVTPRLLHRLDRAGLSAYLPHAVIGQKKTSDNGGFNAVFTREQPRIALQASVDLQAAAVPLAVVPWGNHDVTVAAAHTASPQRGVRRWGHGVTHLTNPAQFEAVRAYCHAHSLPVPDPLCALLAGDFNASASHRSFRSILASVDSSDSQGALGSYGSSDSLQNHRYLIDSSSERRHHPTFPADWPLIPPLLELDHVLHGSGLTCVSLEPITIAGTDHRGLIARFYLKAAR